jgi:hypothetical protein
VVRKVPNRWAHGRPVLQTRGRTWAARLATAQGDWAGALASLAQARLALTAPGDRVRAQLALEEFRVALALAQAEAGALIPRLAANTAPGLLKARLSRPALAAVRAGKTRPHRRPCQGRRADNHAERRRTRRSLGAA